MRIRVLLSTIASLALSAKVSAFGLLAPSSSTARLVDSRLPKQPPRGTLLRAEEGGDGDGDGDVELDYETQWGVDDSYTTTATGLQYKDEVVGTGDSSPEDGGTIELHYSFWFDDFSDEECRETGKKYFSTRGPSNPKSTPMSFQLGETQILEGWSEGMKTMKAGGKRILIIPPELAYGDAGIPQKNNVFPAIPGGSYLRFEIELVKVDNSAFTKFRQWLPKPSSILE
mmetsp:Transcript_13114/g.31048  ORF Transcript_13114/g.31048 Transcript_13114/m.31048 type:complete len:228 (-) Transcript_13114:96-779(-)